MTERFKWGTDANGLSLTAVGIVAVIYQGWLSRILLPKLGEKRTVLISFTFTILEFLGYALVTHGWMVYIVMFATGMSYLGGQAVQGLMSRQVGDNEQGALQGAMNSINSITGIVGPIIATNLFAYFVSKSAPIYLPAVTFYCSAALALIALLISIRVLSGMKHGHELHVKAVTADV